MSDSNDLFSGGRPNPALAGIPLRFTTSGSEPDAARVNAAALLLGRPIKFVDADGYENELIAASPVRDGNGLAYVMSSAKDLGNYVDINFIFVVQDDLGRFESTIESYNPYFGCDVTYLEWFGDISVLIYQEKHDTYIAASTSSGPARYTVIASDWVLRGDQLGYWKYKDAEVKRLIVPALTEAPALVELEALKLGLCPPKRW